MSGDIVGGHRPPLQLHVIIRRTMKRINLLCLAGLLVAATAFAEDFWVTKEYMQWTDEEVKKIITNSPWAKDVTLSAPMAALGRGQQASTQSSPNTDVENPSGGGGGGRGRGRGGGGGLSGGSADALVTLNISWRSASLLRKALVRSRLGAGAAVPPDALEVVSKD